MLLNIPPTKEGLIHERDAERLRELGAYLRRREAHNLAEDAEMTATGSQVGYVAANIRRDDDGCYKTPDGVRSCEDVYKRQVSGLLNSSVYAGGAVSTYGIGACLLYTSRCV